MVCPLESRGLFDEKPAIPEPFHGPENIIYLERNCKNEGYRMSPRYFIKGLLLSLGNRQVTQRIAGKRRKGGNQKVGKRASDIVWLLGRLHLNRVFFSSGTYLDKTL